MQVPTWLDDYERKARLAPGLLVILPVALVLLGFGVRDNPIVVAILAILLSFGVPLVLVKHVRRRGRAKEKGLFEKWGNKPTTALLLPNDDGSIGPRTRQRRANVERVTGVQLPNGTNPSQADLETIDVAVSAVRVMTAHGENFGRIHDEVKSYGFERNVVGVRVEGIVVSSVCVVGLGVSSVLAWTGDIGSKPWPLNIATGCCVLVLLFWLLWPTGERAKEAGHIYAERLLDDAANLPDWAAPTEQ